MPGWSTGCFGSFKKSGEAFYSRNPELNTNEDKDSGIISDERKGISFVELEKRDGMTLGLIITGGIDKNSRPKILNLRPGSIAHRSDALAKGDYIISVNGIRTSKLKYEEILNLLKNTGHRVTLEVEYELPLPCTDSRSTTPKIIQVKLEKERDSFGFTLRGGSCNDRSKSRPLVITHIRFGGPADRTGILKAGDRLLAVDGINLSSATLQDALLCMRQVTQSAVFTIEYDVSCIDAVKNATGPLLVEIDRSPGCLLGINLSSLSVPEHTLVIESIRQASIAERCGALHVGDHVLAIDDIKVDLMTSAEAMQLLRSSVNDTVKLQINPVSQIALRSITENYVKQGELSNDSPSPYTSFTSPLVPMRNFESPNGCTYLLDSGLHLSPDAFVNSNVALSSVTRADRTEVTLHADHKGFGFKLHGSLYPSDTLTSPPVVSYIDPNGPAERSGVMQVGDRILAVNGESTEGMSLEKVSDISSTYPHIVLITEFDVTEAVVPSTGIFIVKLAKKDTDLGISLVAPQNRQQGDPLIIASIRKGSIAHRTGTIQPGDKLLSINSLRTENCTVDDARAILHTCTDIVKLRIKKDDTFSEDPDATCAIVYTVELIRHGGPLGITVSGTKEPFDPIYISGLTESGLAEKTGALHVGDRILAINGNSLRGKTLNEAICILQTCGDAVTLKISKCRCSGKAEDDVSKCIHCIPDNKDNKLKVPKCYPSSTPLPSIDSAVDSWDSCNPGLTSDINQRLNEKYYTLNEHGSVSMSYPNTLALAKKRCLENKDLSWDQTTPRPNSYSGTHSVQSDEEKDWRKVLEDLQTCGQSRLLRHLEHSLGFEENANTEKSCSDEISERNSNCSPVSLSASNLQELTSQIHQLDIDFKHNNHYPDVIEHFRRRDCQTRHSVYNESTNFYFPPASAFSASFPIEIHKVTLFKDQIYEDFGFSLSDGKYENGVYINSIRPGGPADLSGLIKPLDRILQVNGVKTFNAGLIVPLIASSGDRIELVISRSAYDNETSSDDTVGHASNYNPWIDDVDKEETFNSHEEKKTYTKTL